MENSCPEDNKQTSCFLNLPPEQFLLLSFIITMVLIAVLSADQQNSLGNFLSSVGQNLSTSAGQIELLNNESEQNSNKEQVADLKSRIKKLEELVNKLAIDS